MTHHQPPVERRVELVHQGGDVDVGPDLAPVDGVPQDGGGRLTSRLEPARSKGRRQAGVRLRLADELGHDLAGAAGEGVDEEAELCREVRGDVAGVDEVERLTVAVEVRVDRHGTTVGPPFVDGHLADAGSVRDALDRGRLEAPFDEEVGRRLQDGQPRPLAPRPTDAHGAWLDFAGHGTILVVERSVHES